MMRTHGSACVHNPNAGPAVFGQLSFFLFLMDVRLCVQVSSWSAPVSASLLHPFQAELLAARGGRGGHWARPRGACHEVFEH